ncbi:hypothetical protein TVAG_163860 [Trichomonas vaginalis G3]|uniref:BTB domain-containing protein n=1 Tax=Trichomonas vaginalis (strain ATCC PRA-98 / G3) TaxID=412133 RepID=A2DG63_TRIV3|nr:protein ubiquitination [Trichomonas vaginalis G3]EAY20690.1 hypothetical protein TVAG_163860 [Trichomonas vaginalis G3]KAI5487410.1 protein ubiquitination [Trichomonas vaginalis G3]|eukprot:XP_001581676.1 hypothetical protein [Trichomonas vaginalis G3]
MVRIHMSSPILQRSKSFKNAHYAKITINDKEFRISQSHAVSMFEKFYSCYLLDSTFNHLHINCNVKYQDSYDAFAHLILYGVADLECNENVLKDLFAIGKALGCEELMNLFKVYVVDKMEIDVDNCLKILEYYIDIGSEENIIKCIDFVASKFYTIDIEKLKLLSIKFGFDVIQRILNNDKLAIATEDLLASYIIALTKKSKIFFPLVELIKFEHCSDQIVKEIYENTDKHTFEFITKSLYEALIRSRDPKNIERSIYKSKYFRSGNVIMSCSSTYDGSPQYINKYEEDHYFMSNSNSWVEWRIKEKYSIQPFEYILRIAPENKHVSNHIQSWKIEGITVDGESKVISEVFNSPMKEGEIRKIPIKANDRFKSFKLIQNGTNVEGNYYLLIDAFDFSGFIFEIEEKKK